MSDLDDAIERLNPDASPKHVYRGPSSIADVDDDLRLVVTAVRERDALAAVIEEALEVLTPVNRSPSADATAVQILRSAPTGALDRTPSDALTERDARIRAEVIDYLENWGLAYPEDAIDSAREHFGLTKGASDGEQ